MTSILNSLATWESSYTLSFKRKKVSVVCDRGIFRTDYKCFSNMFYENGDYSKLIIFDDNPDRIKEREALMIALAPVLQEEKRKLMDVLRSVLGVITVKEISLHEIEITVAPKISFDDTVRKVYIRADENRTFSMPLKLRIMNSKEESINFINGYVFDFLHDGEKMRVVKHVHGHHYYRYVNDIYAGTFHESYYFEHFKEEIKSIESTYPNRMKKSIFFEYEN